MLIFDKEKALNEAKEEMRNEGHRRQTGHRHRPSQKGKRSLEVARRKWHPSVETRGS
jgi:hypothetical protein